MACSTHHPYGVEPQGNSWMVQATPSCRPSGLGLLHSHMSDALMLELLAHFPGPDLARLAAVSKAFYVFSNFDDLWKNLALLELQLQMDQRNCSSSSGDPDTAPPVPLTLRTAATPWMGTSWKETYRLYVRHAGAGRTCPERETGDGEARAAADAEGTGAEPRSRPPIAVRGFYSDLLYQPFLCSTYGIQEEWLTRRNVDIRGGIDAETFRREYEVPNTPVVLTDLVTRWPAFGKWSKQHFRDEYGEVPFHANGVDFLMKDYIRYAEETREEQPLYIFDKKFADKAPGLARDYSVPEHFSDDLFSQLGQSRPDHRWLIVGPTLSGSSFHIDPNSTSAWNAVLQGSKKWILFPPGVTPPGVHPSADGLDLATPVSCMEWFMNFYDECHRRPAKQRPLEVVVQAGEIIFVPRGWWHCVLNLSWTVAITQNYVSRVNLLPVLRFVHERKHLLSGLPVEERSSLGTRFVEALKAGTRDGKEGKGGKAADGHVVHLEPDVRRGVEAELDKWEEEEGEEEEKKRKGGEAEGRGLWAKAKRALDQDEGHEHMESSEAEGGGGGGGFSFGFDLS